MKVGSNDSSTFRKLSDLNVTKSEIVVKLDFAVADLNAIRTIILHILESLYLFRRNLLVNLQTALRKV